MNTSRFDETMLIKAKENEHLLPTPDYVNHLVVHESLSSLDAVIHRGLSGVIFHNYQLEYLKLLSGVGITTLPQLAEEFKKVQNKCSKLSSKLRSIVQGHYGYYITKIKELEDEFNSTDDKVIEGNYWYKRR